MRRLQNWPSRLWLLRHGQSQGNVARDIADEAGHHEIAIDVRDVDVPLSKLGERQAKAVGDWFAAAPIEERPEVILTSPYIRARQTARLICEAGALAGKPARPHIDERLREREFGVFDRLTGIGIRERFPDEAAHRAMLGKFYHRPPGGESWADVILRLRSVMNTINLHYAGRRVLIVCHQVVVLCFRYILEDLEEQEILTIDREAALLNCGISSYDFEADEQGLCVPRRVMWNFDSALEAEEKLKTSAPDAMTGTR
jgi:2,3-bisphosphoglycerate-dependent phosphoglycerate mutase